MKTSNTLFTVFLACVFIMASSANASEAKKQLRQKLVEISSYRASFVQTVNNALGEELQQTSGILSFGKPERMRWQVQTPDESLSIIDGKHIYNIDPFVEQVTILNQESVTADNPLALLLNDGDAAWEDVEVSQDGTTFVVVSTVSDANIRQLALFFDEQGNLSRFQTTDTQEQVNDLVFSDIQTNPMLALDHFTAVIPDGYEIDDQR